MSAPYNRESRVVNERKERLLSDIANRAHAVSEEIQKLEKQLKDAIEEETILNNFIHYAEGIPASELISKRAFSEQD